MKVADRAIKGGTASISISGDSWLARQFLKNDVGFVAGAQTKVGYARIAVAGAQEYELADGGKFSVESRLGFSAYEKANQSFIGLLLETGLGYENPFGLTLAGDSVMAATNSGQIRELELAGDMSFDRDRDERGLLLNVIRKWEMDYSTTDKPLWNDSFLNNTITGNGKTNARIEIGYGFAVLDDSAVFTPTLLLIRLILMDVNSVLTVVLQQVKGTILSWRLSGIFQKLALIDMKSI